MGHHGRAEAAEAWKTRARFFCCGLPIARTGPQRSMQRAAEYHGQAKNFADERKAEQDAPVRGKQFLQVTPSQMMQTPLS